MYLIKRFLTAGVFVIALMLASMTVSATDTDTLVINYFRFDDDFSFFDSVWLWPHEPESGEGERYHWTDETDFGRQLELDLEGTNLEDSTEIGVIVRGDDWDNRDVPQDLHIDMTDPDEDGVVEVFMVQGDPTIYYDEDEVDTSHRILSAMFDDTSTISYRTTLPVGEEDVEVLANGTSVAIDEFSSDNDTGTITLEEEVDLEYEYTLSADLGEEEPAERVIDLHGVFDSDEFHEEYGYDGELGPIYSEDETEFKLWAPLSESVELNLYEKGHTSSYEDYDGNDGVDDPYETIEMSEGEQGVWSTTVEGDLHGTYFTYTVDNGDRGGPHEVTDPYSYATGLNGQRSMVVDFERQNPDGWEYGRSPHDMDSPADAIIYELHTRDLTSHEAWDGTEDYRGKFLGLVEEGTSHEGVTTGFDHIKELGVTHVHLLPVMDFGMVDESRLDDEEIHGVYNGIFNWGYMPRHFNSLEGSYSTDPYNGEVVVNEFKKMVQEFHENDIGVIMDVVYNHTGQSAESNFHQIVPGYYHRFDDQGNFSDGSGTGNETASDREMFRKFMVDSMTFFVEEYNVDGFRFDLMALHDVETMNTVAEELQEIDEDIVLYGEPWTGGASELPDEDAANKGNLDEMPDIAVFNDDSRDGIAQGHWADHMEIGFVQGDDNADDDVLLGVTGAVDIPGLGYQNPWAVEPTQTVNYVSVHDDMTLHDKLVYSTGADMDDPDDMAGIVRMQRQANNIVLTSQGISFLHAGADFLRTKPLLDPEMQSDYFEDEDMPFDPNSYRSPDETNQLDWDRKVEYHDTFEYYRNLIELRKEKDFLTLPSQEDVQGTLRLMSQEDGMVAYAFEADDDLWTTTLVVHNNGTEARDFDMPGGTWNVVATTDEIGDLDDETTLTTLFEQDGGETIELAANESRIMYTEEDINVFADPDDYEPDPVEDETPWGIIISVAGGVVVIAVAAGVIYKVTRPS